MRSITLVSPSSTTIDITLSRRMTLWQSLATHAWTPYYVVGGETQKFYATKASGVTCLDKCGNAALVQLGRSTGMDVCVTKNPGTYMLSDKMVATVVEAVMGAVYLDGGEMALELVMKESGFDVHQFL
jgi:hypothetical protein